MQFISSFLSNFPAILGDAAQAADGNNMTRTLTFFGVVLVFFYFILWRPEQKRRKKMQETRASLKPGAKVTALGIIGEVVQVNEESQTVILKMFDGSKIEFLKQAVTEIHQKKEEAVVTEEAPQQA